MSGGPPHHPHARQVSPAATAWNHLQVPNYFPTRQPQHAHMSNEHSLLHQPTWHTPTTEPIKPPHSSHIFGLEQMLSDRQYPPPPPPLPRHNSTTTTNLTPGVDLTKQKNGQNGELTQSPISLSVRDTNKINSLPASALEIEPIDTTNKTLNNINNKPPVSPIDKKRSGKSVDSIIERLNPTLTENKDDDGGNNKSVIVQATSSHDENSNSSSCIPVRDDEVVSPFSNEDSLDSNKSRRKRKPSKTIRVTNKEEEKEEKDEPPPKPDSLVKPIENEEEVEEKEEKEDEEVPAKTRRKTSSKSETIDDIAAMVQEGLKDKDEKPISVVSVIKVNPESETNEIHTTMLTPAQKKATTTTTTTTNFVEIENKLEEMFAGIDEDEKIEQQQQQQQKQDEEIEEEEKTTTTGQVTSTSNEPIKKSPKKIKRKRPVSRGNEKNKTKTTKLNKKLKKNLKLEQIKDVYAYDSGSNASSSKSKGPFVQIHGPRDSPLSVNIINTIDDDNEKNKNKIKKYHDDSEYRHKVRSKGLHCSTLSHQYDAQTKDTTWICAFCKRGPHATEITGPTLNGNLEPPGDLFGPYFITTNCSEFERRLDDPYDKQFKSKKIFKVLEQTKQPIKKKRKSSGSGCSGSVGGLVVSGGGGGDDEGIEVYLGITPTSENTYEVWAHEDCIVWSAGTYLVGPKIIGLEEAVWTCCNVICGKCHLKGANICCLKRGCVKVMHICCARLSDWYFDEENFKAFCSEHKP